MMLSWELGSKKSYLSGNFLEGGVCTTLATAPWLAELNIDMFPRPLFLVLLLPSISSF